MAGTAHPKSMVLTTGRTDDFGPMARDEPSPSLALGGRDGRYVADQQAGLDPTDRAILTATVNAERNRLGTSSPYRSPGTVPLPPLARLRLDEAAAMTVETTEPPSVGQKIKGAIQQLAGAGAVPKPRRASTKD